MKRPLLTPILFVLCLIFAQTASAGKVPGSLDLTFGSEGSLLLDQYRSSSKFLVPASDGRFFIQGKDHPTNFYSQNPITQRKFSYNGVRDLSFGDEGIFNFASHTEITGGIELPGETVLTPTLTSKRQTRITNVDDGGVNLSDFVIVGAHALRADLKRVLSSSGGFKNVLVVGGSSDELVGASVVESDPNRIWTYELSDVGTITSSNPYVIPDEDVCVYSDMAIGKENVITTGRDCNGSDRYLIQTTINGTVDTSFGGDGVVPVPTGALSVDMDQNDNIYLMNRSSPPTMRKYLSDGSLDTSFGVSGEIELEDNPDAATIAAGIDTEYAPAQMYVQADGTIVVAARARRCSAGCYHTVVVSMFDQFGNPIAGFNGVTSGYVPNSHYGTYPVDLKSGPGQRLYVLASSPTGHPAYNRVYAFVNFPQPTEIDPSQFGSPQIGGQETGDPVNPATGNLTDRAEDVLVEAPGLNFQMARFYNSLETGVSEFGRGWSWTYGATLEEVGNQVVVEDSDGASLTFTADGAGGYESPFGRTETLENASGDYLLKRRNGVVWTFVDGHVTSIENPIGDEIVIDWASDEVDTVTDPAGREYEFHYTSGKIASIEMPDLTAVSYQYIGNNLTSVTAQDGATTAYEYTDGLMTAKETPSETGNPGSRVEFTYDTLNRVTETDTTNGFQDTSYGYAAAGLMTTVTDAKGEDSVYRFNPQGGVTSITDPYNRTISYTYSEAGLVSSKTDAAGRVTSYEHNIYGEKTKTLGPKPTPSAARPEFTATYNGRGQRASETDARGATRTWTYDSQGLLTTASDENGTTTFSDFNAFGQPQTIESPNGGETDLTYDSDGNVISTVSPEGRTWTFTYDLMGRRTSQIDPRGGITTYQHDDAGRVTEIRTPDPGTGTATLLTVMDYDVRGNLITVTDPLSHTTSFTYDENNLLVSSTDPTGVASTSSYDALGRTISTVQAGVETDLTYLKTGELASKTVDDGGLDESTISFKYNDSGEVTSMTDPNSNVTTYERDNLGRLVKVTDAEAGESEFVYDLQNNLTSSKDPNGNITEYTYDLAGNMTGKELPMGETWSYSYDDGYLISKTAPGSLTTGFEYDLDSNLTKVDYPNNPDETLTWDVSGNLDQVTDMSGITDYVFDKRNRLTRVELPNSVDLDLSYDNADRRISTVSTTPVDDPSLIYAYDNAGRIASITDQDSNQTSMFWNATTGVLDEIDYPETGGTSDYSYDGQGRVSEIAHVSPGFTRTDVYGYDPASNLTGIDSTGAADATFIYDDLNRLTGETWSSLVNQWQGTYEHDSAGNRISSTTGGVAAPEVENDFNANNQITESLVAGASLPATYDWNARGNLTEIDDPEAGITSYGYSDADQVLSIDTPGSDTDLVRDLSGNVVSSSVDDGISVDEQDYVLDPLNDSSSPLLTFGAVNTLTVNAGVPVAQTLFGSTSGDLSSSEPAAVHTDLMGSPAAFVNSGSGVLAGAPVMSSFGVPVEGSVSPSSGYLGLPGVPGSGLLDLNARSYDPARGAFTSLDPVQGRPSLPQTLNQYAYGISNPFGYPDPLGTSIFDTAGEFLAGAANIGAAGMATGAQFSEDLINDPWMINKAAVGLGCGVIPGCEEFYLAATTKGRLDLVALGSIGLTVVRAGATVAADTANAIQKRSDEFKKLLANSKYSGIVKVGSKFALPATVFVATVEAAQDPNALRGITKVVVNVGGSALGGAVGSAACTFLAVGTAGVGGVVCVGLVVAGGLVVSEAGTQTIDWYWK